MLNNVEYDHIMLNNDYVEHVETYVDQTML